MLFFSSWGRVTMLTVLIFLLITTGCQGNPTQATMENIDITESIKSPTEKKEGIIEPLAEVTEITPEQPVTLEVEEASPTIQPTPAPTLSDWREAPISPEEISERVIEIYQEGQKQGRDPHAFSVIGDCQAIPFVFMGPYGRGDLKPTDAEGHLWKVINTFDSSFKRWSVTARGGFTAASVLNPLQADPEECKPGETPLSCEYRLNNPAFVLVTLETWLEPETVDRYEVYLRQIIEKVIERGSVPILLTKADASELRGKEHVINPVIVRVAYENQLPLVNFWRAAQYLENFGIDPDREGFHLSDSGYNLKNHLALRALYQVWTAVEGLESSIEDSPLQTETPKATPTPGVEIAPADCQSGCIFFGTAQSQDGNILGGGVYAYAPETGRLTQILKNGFDLQDVSHDGQRILANQSNQLYEIDLNSRTTTLITNAFFYYGKQGAYWNEDESKVIYLDQENPLQTETGEAINLLPASKDDVLYFENGHCQSKDYCQLDGVYRQDADGEITKMETFAKPIFSPDGSQVAFLNPEAATEENFYHIRYLVLEDTKTGIASRRVLYFPDVSGFMVYADVETYAFSPNSDKLFILYDVYSEYYEYSLRLETYLWDLETGISYDLGELEGISGSLMPRVIWSPDGVRAFFFLTSLSDEGQYHIHIYQTNLETGEHLILHEENLLNSTEYLYLTNIYWP